MNKIEVTLRPEEAFDEAKFMSSLYEKLKLNPQEVFIRPTRRSIDARGKNVAVKIQVEILTFEQTKISYSKNYSDISKGERVIIIGAGPAGLFAAIRLIELGIKPIVFERGKDVQARRRDLAAINKEHIVNPE